MAFKNLRIYDDWTFSYEIREAEREIQLEIDPGKPVLPTVENRQIKYIPPTEHLGKKLSEQSPIFIARLGLAFYQTIFHDAIDRFK